ALDLVGDSLALANNLAVLEAQRRDPGLQAVAAAAARLGGADQNTRQLDAAEFGRTGHDVFQNTANIRGEIERMPPRAGIGPRLAQAESWSGARRCRLEHAHR